MNKKLTMMLALCLTGNAGLALAADAPAQDPVLKTQLSQIDARTKKLQDQLQALQTEIKALQEAKTLAANGKTDTTATASSSSGIIPTAFQFKKHTPLPSQPMSAAESAVASRYSHGLAVIASPFLGQRDLYSVWDLVANLPSMNQDLIILQQRQKLENYAKDHNESIPDRPLVDLSGGVEGQTIYSHDYTGPSTSDIDLTGAKLDVVGEISKFVTTEAVMEYENYPPASGIHRIDNSRLKIGRAFLTIGNLNASPFYGTIGQIYAPFGTYSNYMVTNPITQTIARVKSRVLELGFNNKAGFYGQTYAFKGDSFVNAQNQISQWGLNLGKTGNYAKFSYDLGAGFINNMADAGGMQSTGGTFAGFNASTSTEQLVQRVPGADVHASISYDPCTILAEYVMPTRPFDVTNMSFNGKGARPHALDVQLAYNFTAFAKPSTLSIGTDRSWQALALNVPQQTYFTTLSTSLWKYSVESLEFRHDRNYPGTDTASGTGSSTFSPTGFRDRNIVTLQVGAYF